MGFADMEHIIETEILASTPWEGTRIEPGPQLPDVPNRFILLTRYGGSGLEADGVLDGLNWQVRTVGKQKNYVDAEGLADLIDRMFLSRYSNYVNGFGTPWISDIQRVGGAPAALMVDDADRTHFVCSYIVSTQMALIN